VINRFDSIKYNDMSTNPSEYYPNVVRDKSVMFGVSGDFWNNAFKKLPFKKCTVIEIY